MLAVDISIDGCLVAYGDYLGRLRLSATVVVENEMYPLVGHTDRIRAIQFNPDASKIASCANDRTIRIWDVASRSEVMLLEGQGHSTCVSSLSYSPDGTRLASGSYDHAVRVWDMQSGVGLYVLLGHTNVVYSVSFSNDGRKIVSGSSDRHIVIWDSRTGCEIMKLSGHESGVFGVCCLPILLDYVLK